MERRGNPTKVRKWKDIIEEWQDYMHSMNVQFLTSYNFNFDIGIGDKVGAIRKTHSQTSDKTFIYREKLISFA